MELFPDKNRCISKIFLLKFFQRISAFKKLMNCRWNFFKIFLGENILLRRAAFWDECSSPIISAHINLDEDAAAGRETERERESKEKEKEGRNKISIRREEGKKTRRRQKLRSL